MRFLRIMSVNDDRPEERSREGKETEGEKVFAEGVGVREGAAAVVDGVEEKVTEEEEVVTEGVGDGEGAATVVDGVEATVGPLSYINKEVTDMTQD